MKNVLITTGGTGGHIYPALALADEIMKKNPETNILFIGNGDRMEAKIIKPYGYNFTPIEAKGFNGNSSDKIKSLSLMSKSYRKCKKIINEFKPSVVIGFGGYVTVPVILAAKSCHIPTLIHEQNSVAGLANRFLAGKVDRIITCYPNVTFKKHKCYLLGNPRATIAAQAHQDSKVLTDLGLDINKKTVFIVMGSLGSSSINELMISILQQLTSKDYQIIYVTGEQGYKDVCQQVPSQNNIRILPYVNQVEYVVNCDLIVTRGGATSASEITSMHIPAIIIPSPYVPNNHQFFNAMAMVNAGCGKILEEKDITSDTFIDLLDKTINDDELLNNMRQATSNLDFPNACRDIINLMEEVAND